VAHLVSGAGVGRRGAVPRGEVRFAGKPGDIAGCCQQPAAPEGPMPCRPVSVLPVADSSAVSSLLVAFLRW
jgi:hypothetical protein